MTSSYIHQPLKSVSSVRLIKLLPELIDNHVACEICHFDITNVPDYHALSYYWGDPKPTQTIYIDNFGHPLHENLWQFLHQMRDDGKIGYYWTDALCINQDDEKELRKQVGRMDEIYSHAADVIVWLGHDQRGKKAMELVHRWLPHSVPGHSDDRPHEDVLSEAAIYLLLRPYWVRVWIVQEVVLAQKVFVTYGSISMDLESFQSSVWIFREANLEFDWRPTVWTLCDLRKTGGKKPLWKLLTDFNLCESSKAEDRVYGFLGLVADRSPQCRTAELLEINYFKDIQDVFWDAIFECGAPWSEYRHLLFHVPLTLGKGIDYWNFRSLGDYATKETTSKRHSESAKVALRVFEAMNIIMGVVNAYYEWHEAVGTILSSTKDYSQEHTHLQDAAVLGLALAASMEDIHRLWQNQYSLEKELGVSPPSPWRCIAHRVQGEYKEIVDPDMQLKHPTVQIRVMAHELISACAVCNTSSCSHGEDSTLFGQEFCLTFKIPEIDFCLAILSKAIDSGAETTLLLLVEGG